jgi:hypothetical protein
VIEVSSCMPARMLVAVLVARAEARGGYLTKL